MCSFLLFCYLFLKWEDNSKEITLGAAQTSGRVLTTCWLAGGNFFWSFSCCDKIWLEKNESYFDMTKSPKARYCIVPFCHQHVPDLLVIGTQETFPEKTEWEVWMMTIWLQYDDNLITMVNNATQVRLQDTLGPSHVLFHSASLGTLHLTVFLRYIMIREGVQKKITF